MQYEKEDRGSGSEICKENKENCPFYAHARREREQLLFHFDNAVLRMSNAIAAAWATIGATLDGEPQPWRYLVEEFPAPPDDHPIAHLWLDPDRVVYISPPDTLTPDHVYRDTGNSGDGDE